MNLITFAAILALFGIFNLLCFIIGARVGQAAVKGESIELPNPSVSLNPMTHIRKHQEKKADMAEQERLKTILENIENYNGTGSGQKDVR